MKTKIYAGLLILSALFLTGALKAQTVKPGTVIYENDGLTGTTPQGVVFSVAPDGKSGLIVALTDKTTGEGCEWGPDPTSISGVKATVDRNVALADKGGRTNTQKLVSNAQSLEQKGQYAMQKISETELAAGWYIPTVGELRTLHRILPAVNTGLNTVSGARALEAVSYWSSTAYSDNPDTSSGAWSFKMDEDVPFSSDVFSDCHVRLVRAFRLK